LSLRPIAVLALFGCGNGDGATVPGPTDSDPPTDTDTDTDAPLGPFSGGCEVQDDNVLRYDCTFELEEAGPVSVSLEGGSRSQVFSSTEVAHRHVIALYLMTGETNYTWTATADQSVLLGQFTTGALPPVADIYADITGTGTTDTIVVPFQCGGPGQLVAIDERGQVEWYQNMTVGFGEGPGVLLAGFDASAASLIGLLGHSGIAEFAWTGERLGGGKVGVDYPLPTHHSVFRKGSLRFVLNANSFTEADGTYVMDGVYVFDADWAVLDEWSLREVLTPSGGGPIGGFWADEFPGTVDYSHGNGIDVDDAGDWILSFRGLNTVIKIRGDPVAPDFGSVLWALTTSGLSPFTSDYSVISSNGATTEPFFNEQHHAHLEDDGGLWLFDNGEFGADSRGMRMMLDDNAATADIDQVFQLDTFCSVQSSVYRLPNGHALVACAGNQTLYEFDGVSSEPVWLASLGCNQAASTPLMVRGQPVFW